jgi:multidrug efflux pump subunit AcrA (membrane-fusion protein)
MRRLGSPTELTKPDELELDTERIYAPADIVVWAMRVSADQAALVATGRYGRSGEETWLPASDLHYENWYLRHENAALQQRLETLETRISKLEAVAPELKVIVLRETTRQEAKREIQELFASGDILDYEDIVDRLQLDLELVVAICDELIAEGEIGPDARVHGRR